MSTKKTRSGGKFTGSHTTVIPAAREVADVSAKCPLVTKIALGYIKAGLRSAKGRRALKITHDGVSLLLSVRDNTTHQELHVYATDTKQAAEIIARGVRALGMEVKVA